MPAPGLLAWSSMPGICIVRQDEPTAADPHRLHRGGAVRRESRPLQDGAALAKPSRGPAGCHSPGSIVHEA